MKACHIGAGVLKRALAPLVIKQSKNAADIQLSVKSKAAKYFQLSVLIKISINNK